MPSGPNPKGRLADRPHMLSALVSFDAGLEDEVAALLLAIVGVAAAKESKDLRIRCGCG